MRSRSSVRTVVFAVAAACWLCAAPVGSQDASDGTPTDSEVAAAVDKLKADPNIAQERKTKTLRWPRDDDKPRERSSFGQWLSNFFDWVGQLSRVLIWAVLGVLALLLLKFVVGVVRGLEKPSRLEQTLVPTHVRDLDIRPESLPDDIGAAALELWQRGEHRGALALLYRGLLSRLAHSHQVPIRDSTTEGDCLALASKHLPPERKDYVTRLVRLWQRATYGGRDAQTDEIQALCAEFASALAPPSDGTRA